MLVAGVRGFWNYFRRILNTNCFQKPEPSFRVVVLQIPTVYEPNVLVARGKVDFQIRITGVGFRQIGIARHDKISGFSLLSVISPQNRQALNIYPL